MKFSNRLIDNKKISKLSLGTANFFPKNKLKNFNINELLDFIINNKINFIDTSDQYGGGKCEKLIGNYLKKNNLSKKIFVSTKFGQMNNFSSNSIQKTIDGSLKRLNIENIDIYYFHSGTNKQFDNDKLWTILDKNLISGKINKLGISFKTKYLLDNDLFQLNKGFDYGVSVINLAYNPFFRYAEKIIENKKFNLRYKFTTRLSFSSGLIFKREEIKKKKNFFNPNQYKMLKNKQKIYKNNSDLAVWCLKKIIDKRNIHTTNLGFSSLEQAKIIKKCFL